MRRCKGLCPPCWCSKQNPFIPSRFRWKQQTKCYSFAVLHGEEKRTPENWRDGTHARSVHPVSGEHVAEQRLQVFAFVACRRWFPPPGTATAARRLYKPEQTDKKKTDK